MLFQPNPLCCKYLNDICGCLGFKINVSSGFISILPFFAPARLPGASVCTDRAQELGVLSRHRVDLVPSSMMPGVSHDPLGILYIHYRTHLHIHVVNRTRALCNRCFAVRSSVE